MENIYNDKDYISIVDNILNNDEVQKLSDLEHHNTTRLDHSLRVSYLSYYVTKMLGLDKTETARAGLLHDFFLDDVASDKKKKFTNVFSHSKDALDNAESLFHLSDREKDIIYTHMFPQVPNKLPKYAESWIVCLVDKLVTIYEFTNSYRLKVGLKVKLKYHYSTMLMLLLLSKAI